MALYLFNNGAAQTTAAPVAVTTGTAIKTLLQVVPVTTMMVRIVEWSISFDGSAAATPIKVELIETDVAATVTAAAAADFTKWDADAIAQGTQTTFFQVGTALSGYTATAEGTITAVRNLDAPQFIAPTTQYQKQFPMGREPIIQAGKFARIRVTAGAAVNAYCSMILAV
ncbi:MAG: hypothetical protein ACJ8FU_08615 [Xanthobacteraceae bacterium]